MAAKILPQELHSASQLQVATALNLPLSIVLYLDLFYPLNNGFYLSVLYLNLFYPLARCVLGYQESLGVCKGVTLGIKLNAIKHFKCGTLKTPCVH